MRFSEQRRLRVLMLAHRAPWPPDRGDRIRSWHLLRTLAGRFDVSLACVSEEPVSEAQRAALQAITAQVAVARVSPAWGRARGAAALLAGRAATPSVFYRRSLAARIERWHAAMPFDVVLTFCTGMLGYAERLLRSERRPRHVLDLVDVDSRKWAGYAAGARGVRLPLRWAYAAEAARLARLERGPTADAVTVISAAEAKAYRQEIDAWAPLHVVGNGVDLDYFTPQPDCPSDGGGPAATFVGVLDYRPNIEGIGWFVREVWPMVRAKRRDAALRIVGKRPCREVLQLAQAPGVTVVGEVADVRPWLARSACVVAPLRTAPGVQNKVLEAMASARAVACTPGAAEGIDATPGEHLLTADEPAALAHHVARLLGDTAKRTAVARAARRRVEERYRWDAVLEPMVRLVAGADVAAARDPRQRQRAA